MRTLLLLILSTLFLDASYEKANNYYKNGNYQKAIDEVKRSTSEYENPKLHLLWANSAKKLGRVDEAMSAYERVVILDKSSSEARVALLEIYRASSRDALASSMAKELQNYQLTPEQRSSLELLSAEDINSFKSRASICIGYDTNINISAHANDLDIYYGIDSSEGELPTLFSRFSGSASYINEIQERGGWFVRSDLKLYYQNNFNAHYFDMFLGGIELGVGYAGSGYTLYMPVGYNRVNYLETDLLEQIKVAPKLNIVVNNSFILNINAKYSLKSYKEENYKGMDDSSYGVGLGAYYIFDKNYAYIQSNYEKFSSEEELHYFYIDKKLVRASLGINYNMSDWLVTKLEYRYRNTDYDDSNDLKNISSTKEREDNYNQIELKLSHFIADNFEIFISNKYIKNSSNYLPARYSKNIALLGISANY